MISESTKARFAKEVAKYPPEQKQSAVMACLSIVQQEQGFVSTDAEREIRLIANLAELPPAAIHQLDMKDYAQLQKVLGGFLQ